MSEHPSDERLQRLADGEMVETGVREHVETCVACSGRFNWIDRATADYREYHDAVKAQDPVPPRPWADLRPGMASRRASWRGWAAAAAVVAIAAAGYYRISGPTPVSAAELLRKAVAAEHPATAPRRIRVKTAKREIVRRAVLAVPPAGELEAMFVAARFSWQEPFSARSFAAWRDGLADKRDSVRRDGGHVEIETSTTDGPLRTATLVLDANLRPVRETLVFTGDQVEISEVADEPPPSAAAAAPAIRTPAPASQAAPGTELRVLAALRAIDADLGEPVQVVRDAGGVVVTATGLMPARERIVREAVAGIAGVTYRVETIPPVDSEQSPDRKGGVAQPRPSQLVGVLGEEGVNRILDASESVMARAYALRGLSRRFPPTVEAQLADADRDVLAALRGEHVSGIGRHVVALRSGIASLLPKSADPPTPATAEWQTKAERLFAAAQAVDHLLNRALAGGQDFARLAPELAEAMGRLEAEALE